MYVDVLLTVAACLLALLYATWRRVRDYWKDRGVPFEPPNPIFGSLSFLQRHNPGLWLRQLYQLKSPYVGIWFLWRPGLVVNSPEIARRILVKDFANFKNRYLSSGATDPIGGLNLLTLNDPLWSSMRNRLSSVFTAAKLRILQEYIGIKAKELTQRIHNDKDNPINLRVIFADYTTDVIGTSAFGVASDATLTGKGPMRSITHDFGKFGIMRGLSWCSIFFFPDFVDYFRFKFFPRGAEECLKQMFRTIVKSREENTAVNRDSKDLLDALINIKKEKMKNNEVSEVEMGGAHSSKNDPAPGSAGLADPPPGRLTISNESLRAAGFRRCKSEACGSPCKRPSGFMKEKLYKELKEAKERIENKDFDARVLSELTYLNCCIKECLRKYTPMGWLDRIAIADYQIDDNLTIKAGTPVYVNSIGMHYDPDYFPDPEKFDPDRFLPENEKDIKQYTYMPFGEGPRFCIGSRFAKMTIRYALASMFLNFKMLPVPNEPRPEDVKIDNRCILYLPGKPLLVKFVPRN